MKNNLFFLFLLSLLPVLPGTNSAQNITGTNDIAGILSASSGNTDLTSTEKKEGRFYIGPFYQYTRFKELKLKKNSNHYNLYEGSYTYNTPEKDITEYNDNFGTEYENNLVGLNIVYQLTDNIGISTYAGMDNFQFKSWISKEGSQYHSTNNPAFGAGATVYYQSRVYDNLYSMALFAYNYCHTSSVPLENNSGETNSTVKFTSGYWEINLYLGYPVGRFLPYAGAGFTQLYVNSDHEELIPTEDNTGAAYINRTSFNSEFKGTAILGAAGLQYFFSKSLALNIRSTFPNPFRLNASLIISL